MYHFIAEQPAAPLVLSSKVQVPGRICQYLKDFQIEAIRFVHAHLAKRKCCLLNDESGLGKTVAVTVLLGAIAAQRKSLIVVQNDDELVHGWQFHLGVLTELSVTVIDDRSKTTDSPHNVYVAKWATLRALGDLSKYNFDIVILDNRGQMLDNNFCTSMLLKHYEQKVNVIISSVDVTSDIKLLHNMLRLGGWLERQYESFKAFEEKFRLPDTKDILSKKLDLEQYFLKREMLTDYCKTFRLRRYRHQYESVLPLVEPDTYKRHFAKWLAAAVTATQNINETAHNSSAPADNETEELYEEFFRRKQFLSKNKVLPMAERPALERGRSEEASEEPPVVMSPLLVVSDSETDEYGAVLEHINSMELIDLTTEEERFYIPNGQSESHGGNTKNAANFNEENEARSRDILCLDQLENKRIVEQTKEGSKEKVSAVTKAANVRNIQKDKDTELGNEGSRQCIAVVPNAKANGKGTKAANKIISPPHIENERKLENVNTLSKGRIPAAAKTAINNSNKDKLDTVEVKNLYKQRPKETKIREVKARSIQDKSMQKDPKETLKIENKRSRKDSECFGTCKPKTRSSQQGASVGAVKNFKLGAAKNKRDLKSEFKSKTTQIKVEQKVKRQAKKPEVTTERRQLRSVKKAETKPQSKKPTVARRKIDKAKAAAACKVIEVVLMSESTYQTRGMSRLTRSAGTSKHKYLMLDSDRKRRRKKYVRSQKCPQKEGKENQAATAVATAESTNANAASDNEACVAQRVQTPIFKTPNNIVEIRKNSKISQLSVIPSSSEYDEIECGQKLTLSSNNSSEHSCRAASAQTANLCVAPPCSQGGGIRNAQNAPLLSLSSYFNASELAVVPTSENPEVITLSSSLSGSQSSQSSQSRRTRALKPNKTAHVAAATTQSKFHIFGEPLEDMRSRHSAQSPDLFSNCSEAALACTQVKHRSTFEGFKMFGSEVKSLQQQHAAAAAATKHTRERSCLDILEKMFEPRAISTNESTQATTTTAGKRRGKTKAAILPTIALENICVTIPAATTAKSKKLVKKSRSPIVARESLDHTSNEVFSHMSQPHMEHPISARQTPEPQQQARSSGQHNKITNYLIGSLTQPARSGMEQQQSAEHLHATPSRSPDKSSGAALALRRSPKSPRSPKSRATQATKLTRWLLRNGKHGGSAQTQQPHHSDESEEGAKEQSSMMHRKSGRSTAKRRRLDMSHKN